MSIEKPPPPPLHPDTIAEMKHDGWHGWVKGIRDLEEITEYVDRTMRQYKPTDLMELMQLAADQLAAIAPEDHDSRIIAKLGQIKLSELIQQWYNEVTDGLHDYNEDTDAGDAAQ